MRKAALVLAFICFSFGCIRNDQNSLNYEASEYERTRASGEVLECINDFISKKILENYSIENMAFVAVGSCNKKIQNYVEMSNIYNTNIKYQLTENIKDITYKAAQEITLKLYTEYEKNKKLIDKHKACIIYAALYIYFDAGNDANYAGGKSKKEFFGENVFEFANNISGIDRIFGEKNKYAETYSRNIEKYFEEFSNSMYLAVEKNPKQFRKLYNDYEKKKKNTK